MYTDISSVHGARESSLGRDITHNLVATEGSGDHARGPLDVGRLHNERAIRDRNIDAGDDEGTAAGIQQLHAIKGLGSKTGF